MDAPAGRMKDLAPRLVEPEPKSKHEHVVIHLSLEKEKNVDQKHN